MRIGAGTWVSNQKPCGNLDAREADSPCNAMHGQRRVSGRVNGHDGSAMDRRRRQGQGTAAKPRFLTAGKGAIRTRAIGGGLVADRGLHRGGRTA